MAPTLYQQRSRNAWRTALLMAVFLAIVLFIGYFVSYYYGNPAILYGAVIFAVAMNFYSYWFSDRQVLSMTNARPASKEQHFDFYTVTENLAITAGIPHAQALRHRRPFSERFRYGAQREARRRLRHDRPSFHDGACRA